MKKYTIFIIMTIAFLCFHQYVFSENSEPVISAWEKDDLQNFKKAVKDDTNLPVIDTIFLSMIKFYQEGHSGTSIKRCPFFISCSHFMETAVRKYGLFLGMLLFIDRNLYREHRGAFFYYPLRENKNNILLLDDSFYILNGDPLDEGLLH